MRGWDDLRIAISFLTVLPVGRSLPCDAPRLARSMTLFPAVGLLLGLLLAVSNWALQLILPPLVVAALVVLLLIRITGALHLDGLADLTDGLAGGRDRATRLRIMKDSRIGAIGAVALIMALLLKVVAIYSLPLQLQSATLVLMPASGRWLQVLLSALCDYARPEGGTAGAFVDNVAAPQALFASLTLIAAALLLFGVPGVWLLIGLGVLAVLARRYLERQLGGVTGDALGAATEAAEITTLLLVLALHPAL
jgi:adenosylcobinamide-GDP ribazoletransferase